MVGNLVVEIAVYDFDLFHSALLYICHEKSSLSQVVRFERCYEMIKQLFDK